MLLAKASFTLKEIVLNRILNADSFQSCSFVQMERSSKTTTSIASVRLCGFRNCVMEWGAEGLGGSKYRYILLLRREQNLT